MSIGAILLAAGASRRLGTPKQLVIFDNETLIRRAANALLAADCDPVVVVLGYQCAAIADELRGLPLDIAINPDWREGMGSSIRAGVAHITRIRPDLAAVLISLCDQPAVTGGHLTRLVALYRNSRKPIAASHYGETYGVPAIFSRQLWSELESLAGDSGAKKLIGERSSDIACLDLPAAAWDVDRIEDFA